MRRERPSTPGMIACVCLATCVVSGAAFPVVPVPANGVAPVTPTTNSAWNSVVSLVGGGTVGAVQPGVAPVAAPVVAGAPVPGGGGFQPINPGSGDPDQLREQQLLQVVGVYVQGPIAAPQQGQPGVPGAIVQQPGVVQPGAVQPQQQFQGLGVDGSTGVPGIPGNPGVPGQIPPSPGPGWTWNGNSWQFTGVVG